MLLLLLFMLNIYNLMIEKCSQKNFNIQRKKINKEITAVEKFKKKNDNKIVLK